jgi:hypothetical protein
LVGGFLVPYFYFEVSILTAKWILPILDTAHKHTGWILPISMDTAHKHKSMDTEWILPISILPIFCPSFYETIFIFSRNFLKMSSAEEGSVEEGEVQANLDDDIDQQLIQYACCNCQI